MHGFVKIERKGATYMSKKIRENEELSALIDSIENDDTMERKIRAFKQKKHRKKQGKQPITQSDTRQSDGRHNDIKPTQPIQNGSNDVGHTRVIKPASTPASHTGVTTVFDPDAIKPSTSSNNETVVLDDNKIQTMIEETQNPSFQGEEDFPAYEDSDPSSRLSRKQGIIIVFGVICVLFVVMAVVNYINSDGNIFNNRITENSSEYQELLAWAEKYDDLTKSQREEIIEYEDIYNNCTSEQQDRIDKVLKDATGKTFNQLLAIAKSNKKSNEKNNNVKSAEKKAKLKKRITALQSQLSTAQNNVTNLQNAQNTVKNQIDQLTTQIQQAQQSVSDAQAKLSEAQSKLSSLQSDASPDDDKSSEIKAAQSAVNDAQEAYEKAVKNHDVTSLQAQINDYQDSLNDYQSQIQQAQAEVDHLNAQIAELQSQLSKLN